jgi:hypothetical protein
MTSEQFGALLRTILQPLAVLAVAKGIGDENLWLAVTAGIVSVGTGLWSFFWIKKAST